MPTKRSLRFLPAVALVGLLSSTSAFAYQIILKDGSRITAKDKPTVKGKYWVYQTNLGSPQQIAAEDVDVEKTEKYNAQGVGDAYTLDDAPGSRAVPTPSDKKPSLGEYIKQHKKTEIGADPATPQRPVEAPAERGTRGTAPVGRAPEAAATPSVDTATNDAFARAFDASNVRGAKLAPIPSGLKIAAVTDSETQVFGALMATARGMKEARSGGRNLDKVGLTLATATNENAGKFVMSTDDAEALLSGKTSAQKYFVAHVAF